VVAYTVAGASGQLGALLVAFERPAQNWSGQGESLSRGMTVRHRIWVAECAGGESSPPVTPSARIAISDFLRQGPDPLQTTYIKNGVL